MIQPGNELLTDRHRAAAQWLPTTVLDDSVYNQIRPTAAVTPTLYGLPEVHKDNVPLRPIICSIGSLTYQCVSWLSKSLAL